MKGFKELTMGDLDLDETTMNTLIKGSRTAWLPKDRRRKPEKKSGLGKPFKLTKPKLPVDVMTQ